MKDQLSSLYVRSSALDPAGPQAQSIFELTSWMTWVFGAVFVLVMILLFFGVFAKESQPKDKSQKDKPPLGNKWFILGGGVVFPTVILSGLLIYTLLLMAEIDNREGPVHIKVTGHMWWWDVEYLNEGITTANEIYIPVGQKVKIELYSHDVIHSLWVPSLAGKMDLIPGHTNIFSVQASQAGVYRGQCAEYCGLQHARMSLYIVALEPGEYKAWIDTKKLPPLFDEKAQAAFKVFNNVGCAECHTIDGTPASSKIGPDLTRIGSRMSLGAGTLPNSKGHLAGWIADPQALKPGNKMPRTYLEPAELHQLVDYLMGLK